MRTRHLALPIAALALALLAGCSSTPSDTASPTTETGTCSYTEAAGGVREVNAPPAEPTVTGTVAATIKTSAGDLKVSLDADRTPCTVNSFVSLAEQKYYDDTQCHRLTTQDIFVLQCGDPSATGSGGPGYKYDDELDGSETYPAGTIAMANAGPGTNGSQFFLVYEDTQLSPNYTVFGTMDAASTASVKAIAAKGLDPASPNASQGDGAPVEAVQISSVTID